MHHRRQRTDDRRNDRTSERLLDKHRYLAGDKYASLSSLRSSRIAILETPGTLRLFASSATPDRDRNSPKKNVRMAIDERIKNKYATKCVQRNKRLGEKDAQILSRNGTTRIEVDEYEELYVSMINLEIFRRSFTRTMESDYSVDHPR